MSMISKDLKYIISLFIGTRIALTSIGVLSRILLDPYHGKEYVWIYSNHLWLDIWGVWDSGWYLGIAKNGYIITDLSTQSDFAFFPLYPLLMRTLGFVIGDNYIAGIIISNICLLVACVFLYKLILLDADEDLALRSVKCMFLFPTAFVLSGIFTESLFLALALGCFYYARKGNWLLVGALGFGLSLTRSTGVIIILPMLYEYLKSKPINKDILFMLLIPTGSSFWMAYNYLITGDPLAFIHVQAAWGRTLVNPLSVIYGGLTSPEVTPHFLAIFTIVSLALMIVFTKRIRPSYWFFGMCVLLIPLFTGLDSMPRYILGVFPLFIVLANMAKERQVDDVLTIFLALLQGFLMVFWANGFNLIV